MKCNDNIDWYHWIKIEHMYLNWPTTFWVVPVPVRWNNTKLICHNVAYISLVWKILGQVILLNQTLLLLRKFLRYWIIFSAYVFSGDQQLNCSLWLCNRDSLWPVTGAPLWPICDSFQATKPRARPIYLYYSERMQS